MDEDNRIDDSGVDLSHHKESDNEHAPSQVLQVGIKTCLNYAFVVYHRSIALIICIFLSIDYS